MLLRAKKAAEPTSATGKATAGGALGTKADGAQKAASANGPSRAMEVIVTIRVYFTIGRGLAKLRPLHRF